MIFQAMGAKYSFGDVVHHLFQIGSQKDLNLLKSELTLRYSGEATLYRKGRAALAEAIRIATGGSGSVAISALTCYSVVEAVEAAGCTPVYIDIQDETLHFDAESLKKSLMGNTDIKAVVIQNMLGIPVDIASIHKVTVDSKLTLIEDLAHSAGAHYSDGREVGTVGDITMLSFGRDKAIDAVNGGALVVRSGGLPRPQVPSQRPRFIDQFRDRIYPIVAWKTRVLYPLKGVYIMSIAIKLKLVVRSADGGVNTDETLSSWQGKLALKQFDRLSDSAESRRNKTHLYSKFLTRELPAAAYEDGATPIRVPLLVSNRDEVVAYLKSHNIQVNDIWYDVPVSPRRYFKKVSYPEAENPNAVRIASQLINLPTHERMTNSQIELVAGLVNEVAK